MPQKTVFLKLYTIVRSKRQKKPNDLLTAFAFTFLSSNQLLIYDEAKLDK